MRPRLLLLTLLLGALPAFGQGVAGTLGGRAAPQVTPFPGGSLFAPSTALGKLGVALAEAPLDPRGRATPRDLRRIAVLAGTPMVPGLRRVVEDAGLPVTRITDRDALRPALKKVGAEGELDRLWSSVEGFKGAEGAVYLARYVGHDPAHSAWVEGTLVIVQQERTGRFLVFHVQEYGE